MPPAAFQTRKRHQLIRAIPATQARSPVAPPRSGRRRRLCHRVWRRSARARGGSARRSGWVERYVQAVGGRPCGDPVTEVVAEDRRHDRDHRSPSDRQGGSTPLARRERCKRSAPSRPARGGRNDSNASSTNKQQAAPTGGADRELVIDPRGTVAPDRRIRKAAPPPRSGDRLEIFAAATASRSRTETPPAAASKPPPARPASMASRRSTCRPPGTHALLPPTLAYA